MAMNADTIVPRLAGFFRDLTPGRRPIAAAVRLYLLRLLKQVRCGSYTGRVPWHGLRLSVAGPRSDLESGGTAARCPSPTGRHTSDPSAAL